MKKIIALLLALAMVLSLTACGSNTSGKDEDSSVKEVPLDEEIVLVDNESITIIATAKFEDPMPNFTYKEVGYRVYIENHTDSYVSISYANLSVDGFMVDGRFNYIEAVAPQKKAYSSLAIYVDKNSSLNVVETIDDLFNTDGTIEVNRNSDGSNHYYGTDWGGEFHID